MARVILVSMLVSLAALTGCSPDTDADRQSDDRVRVVASIFPIADVIRQIGGDDVKVDCMLGAGSTPHNFQPTPHHAEQLARAQLVVVIGLGVDEWAMPGVRAAAGEARLLTLADGLELLPDEAHEHALEEHEAEELHEGNGHGHEHLRGDPHIWLDPILMQDFVRQITTSLAEIDPARAEQYAQRRDEYLAQLRTLDEEYRQKLVALPHKEFVVFHPAFAYVAARYGLHQQALTSVDAEDFGPEQLEETSRFIREHNVRAIFAEPQFPAEQLTALAETTGVSVGVLDPLGQPGVEGYDSYLAMMRSNLTALAAALKDQP